MGSRNRQVTTAAIQALRSAAVPFMTHQYDHDPRNTHYGAECAAALSIDPSRVFKTLVIATGSGFAIAMVPVDRQAQLKLVAQQLGVKHCVLASQADAERRTGYVFGGVSPFGQRQPHHTVIDDSVLDHDTVFVSGGRRGVDVEVAPADLIRVTQATVAPIASRV